VSATWDQVAKADELGERGLRLTFQNGGSAFLPASIEGYVQVRAIVAAHSHIAVGPAPSNVLRLGWGYVLTGLMVAGMILMYRESTPSTVVVPVGLILVATLAWCMWSLRRNSGTDPQRRRLVWLCLLPMFSIVGRVVFAVIYWKR
jgi:hypothetical protein